MGTPAFPSGEGEFADSAQLAQIQEVRDLGLCIYTPEGSRHFLRTPLPTFDGRTPLQMIEQGRADARRIVER